MGVYQRVTTSGHPFYWVGLCVVGCYVHVPATGFERKPLAFMFWQVEHVFCRPVNISKEHWRKHLKELSSVANVLNLGVS